MGGREADKGFEYKLEGGEMGVMGQVDVYRLVGRS
jgi:hypothetical protein